MCKRLDYRIAAAPPLAALKFARPRPTRPPPPGPTTGTGADLASNLGLGLRLAGLLAPRTSALRVSWSQFVLLTAIGIAVPCVADLARVGWHGRFSLQALPGALFHVPLMLLAAWALTLLGERRRDPLALLVAIAALAIPIEAASDLFDAAIGTLLPTPPRGWWPLIQVAPLLWLALAASVAAIRLLQIVPGRRLAAAVVAGLVMAVPPALVDYERSFWFAAYDTAAAAENQRKRMALAGEEAFYLQPKLLERELAALQPGRPGVIDLYFVGVAGDWSQDVFMKEVHSVARLFAERFDTAGRSVMLINNASTVTESPIASATSLEAALRRVGELIDRDEDIVFLYLSSHGSEDHRFALDFWPLHFNTLDPKRLRRILDASGIKRRVIVVSACYAGGFIDELRDENSLIIAAAAPDKTSFGCSNEADFTYFGKAYFDQALRRTWSFTEAFALARPAIAEREQKENFAGSDPRIDLGAAIRQPLEEFARARQAAQLPAVQAM